MWSLKLEMWWHKLAISGLWRQRQEDHESEASVGSMARPCLNLASAQKGRTSKSVLQNKASLILP